MNNNKDCRFGQLTSIGRWIVLGDTGSMWYWISIVRYWLALGGTGSQHGAVVVLYQYRGAGWYLMVLVQFGATQFATQWYWAHMPL